MTSVPPLTWLYVPADRPDRVEKAIASRAHAVIVDLEDGVAPGAKEEARAALAGLLSERRRKPVYVRVNAGDDADLEAVAVLQLSGIVVPKVGRPEDVPATPHPVNCLIESAAGLEAAYAIASEALANAAKHSGAPDAHVSLSVDADSLRIEVQDRGRGMVALPDADPHFGIRIMKARAEALGGSLDMTSTPGHGTTVVAVLPVTRAGEGR